MIVTKNKYNYFYNYYYCVMWCSVMCGRAWSWTTSFTVDVLLLFVFCIHVVWTGALLVRTQTVTQIDDSSWTDAQVKLNCLTRLWKVCTVRTPRTKYLCRSGWTRTHKWGPSDSIFFYIYIYKSERDTLENCLSVMSFPWARRRQ